MFYPDPNWILIQQLCGFGSVFWIRIHTITNRKKGCTDWYELNILIQNLPVLHVLFFYVFQRIYSYCLKKKFHLFLKLIMYGNYVKRLGSGSNNVFGSTSFNLIFLSNLSEWPVVELFTKSQLLISAVRSAAICFPFSSSAPTCRAVSLESELFEYIPVIWHRQSMLSMRKVSFEKI